MKNDIKTKRRTSPPASAPMGSLANGAGEGEKPQKLGISAALHHRLKVKAALLGQSMKQLVETKLEELFADTPAA